MHANVFLTVFAKESCPSVAFSVMKPRIISSIFLVAFTKRTNAGLEKPNCRFVIMFMVCHTVRLTEMLTGSADFLTDTLVPCTFWAASKTICFNTQMITKVYEVTGTDFLRMCLGKTTTASNTVLRAGSAPCSLTPRNLIDSNIFSDVYLVVFDSLQLEEYNRSE